MLKPFFLPAFYSTGRYKLLTVFGAICASFSFALLVFRWHGDTNLLETLYTFPSGFGCGIATAALFVGLNAGVKQGQTAIAGAGYYLSMNIGEVIGMSICNAILQANVKLRLEEFLLGREHGLEVRFPASKSCTESN